MFDTLSVKARGSRASRSRRCPTGGAIRRTSRSSVSRTTGSPARLRSLVPSLMWRSRSAGSGSPSGRSTQKKESRLAARELSVLWWRLTGTFARKLSSGVPRTSIQRRRLPATTARTASLTVAPGTSALVARFSALSDVEAKATVREAPTTPSSSEGGRVLRSSRRNVPGSRPGRRAASPSRSARSRLERP